MKEIKLWYNNIFVFMTHHENESTIVEVVNKLLLLIISFLHLNFAAAKNWKFFRLCEKNSL